MVDSPLISMNVLVIAMSSNASLIIIFSNNSVYLVLTIIYIAIHSLPFFFRQLLVVALAVPVIDNTCLKSHNSATSKFFIICHPHSIIYCHTVRQAQYNIPLLSWFCLQTLLLFCCFVFVFFRFSADFGLLCEG